MQALAGLGTPPGPAQALAVAELGPRSVERRRRAVVEAEGLLEMLVEVPPTRMPRQRAAVARAQVRRVLAAQAVPPPIRLPCLSCR